MVDHTSSLTIAGGQVEAVRRGAGAWAGVTALIVQYQRHREMKEALEKQRADLEDKRRRLESGRPLTPEKGSKGAKKVRSSCRKRS